MWKNRESKREMSNHIECNDAFRYLHLGLPEHIRRKAAYGDLGGAITEIKQMLARQTLSPEMRQCLLAEEEMLRRLPSDFPYTKAHALALVKNQISDFNEQEFDALEQSQRIRWIYVNGEKHYFDRFFETLCKTEQTIAERAGCETAPRNAHYFQKAIAQMRQQGQVQKKFHCRASLQVKPEIFQSGQQVLACLPLPCVCAAQREICIDRINPENSSSQTVHIAPEDAPQRAIFWSETMHENHRFSVAFSYVRTAAYQDLWAQALTPRAEAVWESAADLEIYLKEQAPHLMFTPYIKALARELTAQCKRPLEQARAIYDFVTTQVRYTFMPAYFSQEAIADNCAKSLAGDCGVQTLLFLTLCRCVGIPARWESGWAAEPDFCGAHDWAQFYVEPFGWLYADVSYGGDAAARGDEETRRFYFGNLDPYRMTANTEFQAAFDVEKSGWRADPYDNQVGEIELDGRGLTYSEFLRTKEVVCIEMR